MINKTITALPPCDDDVFKNGKSVCLVDISKDAAEDICRNLSAATGCKIDWHYIGGRVHIKALATPVVERQEPFGYWLCPKGLPLHGVFHKPDPDIQSASVIESFEITPLYASRPAPVSAVRDERAEFVAWVRREWPQAPLSNVRDLLPKDDPRYGEYCDETLQRAWVGWQARGALAGKS